MSAVNENLTDVDTDSQYDNLSADLATITDDQFICASESGDLNTVGGTTIFAYKL